MGLLNSRNPIDDMDVPHIPDPQYQIRKLREEIFKLINEVEKLRNENNFKQKEHQEPGNGEDPESVGTGGA